MIRKHWRELNFWPWWWHNCVPFDTKVVTALVGVCLLGLGGYFAANGLSGTVATPSAQVVEVRTLTVQQLVATRDEAAVAAEAAPPRTVVVTGTERPRTHTVVRTSERVVIDERVVTSERVVTRPVTTTKTMTERVPVTQTVQSTQTVHSTQTVPVTTTVLVTVPVTVTVTVTEKKRGRGGDDDDD